MENRKPLPGYQVMCLCPRCAEKLAKLRPVEEIRDSISQGECGLCWRSIQGSRYKIYPQPRKRYRSYTGSGERARAGRR